MNSENKTILVVDTETRDRRIIREHLMSMGYGIVEAADEKEILERITGQPSLVLREGGGEVGSLGLGGGDLEDLRLGLGQLGLDLAHLLLRLPGLLEPGQGGLGVVLGGLGAQTLLDGLLELLADALCLLELLLAPLVLL